ncbi:DUF4362 domain-containing protein [Anaerocolumna xylanovorans]|uniref:Lipoprotein n=1 Tax=Anaerocolumna xylanovorans DSM 12503 TaxID=1121345 RepID=A0A1M7YH08_9FIRM|nr:DUF4362 domain-containing protein [Anaerocolumna xylanovorans]SHO51944.1 protein of unknown function [Anaerocolumna xylanovorans DSM 12503]
MKRIAFLFLFVTLALVQSGCSMLQSSGREPAFDAIVISASEGSLMVAVSGKGETLSPFEPASVSYNKTEKSVFTRGTLIRITYDGTVRESYPVQLTAKKITVIEEVKDNWPPTSQLKKDYSPEEAKEDGCYVESLSGKENKDIAARFQGNSSQGICAYLRKVAYTVEGDPVITDFIYDGTKFYVINDATRDAFAGSGNKIMQKEYLYINTYEKGGTKIIYLADEKDISQEEYEEKVMSAKGEALLDTFTVYSE